MQPIHICQTCAVGILGVDTRWDGGENKSQEEVESEHHCCWRICLFLGFCQVVQKADVGKEGESKQLGRKNLRKILQHASQLSLASKQAQPLWENSLK